MDIATHKVIDSRGTHSMREVVKWFLLPPLLTFAVSFLILAFIVIIYQNQHEGRIYTGVHIGTVDLSRMTRNEARTELEKVLVTSSDRVVTFTDPRTGRKWARSHAELGIRYDTEESLDAAFKLGRMSNPFRALRDQFVSWYYGYPVAPVLVFDEGRLDAELHQIANEINKPTVDAQVNFDRAHPSYKPGQMGRKLDIADAKVRLVEPLIKFRDVHLELLIHDIRPRILDDSTAVTRIQAFLSSPMTLYIEEPLGDNDLERVDVSTEQLAGWLRVEIVEDEAGAHHNVFTDENAVRHWLLQLAPKLYKPPQNARFYFDDGTRNLVLVEPHVNGRSLDVEATLEQFMAQVDTPNRSLPFVMEEITPTVHSQVTGAELGITELITEATTWFYGSTPERKHNIARAASQFFGIVIAPGEEFSFNRYLGDVTEEAGFTVGLVIIGGRTVEDIGGGVCQVSTTLYQAAFWSGFPITVRQEHPYRVHYYDDGEGPGMDATVYKSDDPSVPGTDFRFVNNTDHYLLIENYYNETNESLTFKFYSTSTGRTVEKEGPFSENVQPPKPDVWEYNEELEPGEIKKVDWAVEGADVTVYRRVYDTDGSLMYGNEAFVSHYYPWQNVYEYGPDVDPNNVSPEDIPD